MYKIFFGNKIKNLKLRVFLSKCREEDKDTQTDCGLSVKENSSSSLLAQTVEIMSGRHLIQFSSKKKNSETFSIHLFVIFLFLYDILKLIPFDLNIFLFVNLLFVILDVILPK